MNSGVHTPAVWFNLGNAAYKAGQIGQAIAAYRFAERLTPRDQALRANLQFVRTKVYSDERRRVPAWKSIVRLGTPNEWTILCASLLWIFFSIVAFGELVGKRYAKTYGGTLGLLALSGVALAATIHDQRSSEAIVTANEATARLGPLDESQAAFELRDGAELRVLRSKDQWVQVRDAERRVGWVRRDSILLLPARDLAAPRQSARRPMG